MAEELSGEIQNYLAMHGHQNFELYELDEEVLKTMQEIVDFDLPEFNGVNIPYIKKKTLMEQSKAFCASKLLFHKVGIMSDEALIRLIRRNKINDLDTLVDLYNTSAKYVSSFEIPIKYTGETAIFGKLITQLIILPDNEEFKKILPKLKVFFNRIILSKRITSLTVPCYIHELMHTQIESQKGIIDNYYDSEVLSIFMELLYVYENKDLYKLILTNKINDMFKRFHLMYLYQTEQYDELKEANDGEEFTISRYCSSGKYLLSILKAFQLLDLYLSGNYSVKKDILIKMQSVLDGAKSLGEFLNSFDVNYESSLDAGITKRLLKY